MAGRRWWCCSRVRAAASGLARPPRGRPDQDRVRRRPGTADPPGQPGRGRQAHVTLPASSPRRQLRAKWIKPASADDSGRHRHDAPQGRLAQGRAVASGLLPGAYRGTRTYASASAGQRASRARGGHRRHQDEPDAVETLAPDHATAARDGDVGVELDRRAEARHDSPAAEPCELPVGREAADVDDHHARSAPRRPARRAATASYLSRAPAVGVPRRHGAEVAPSGDSRRTHRSHGPAADQRDGIAVVGGVRVQPVVRRARHVGVTASVVHRTRPG